MKRVNVAMLKSGLSGYRRTVRAGTEVVVTSHDHPVAKLVPYIASAAAPIQPPRLPAVRWRDLRGVLPRKPCDPLAILLADRARR